MLKIALVGCGAIGSSLAKGIRSKFSESAKLVALFDIDMDKSQALSRLVSGRTSLAVACLEQAILKADLVIEAASAKVSSDIALRAVDKGRDVMVMSVGGLVGNMKQLMSGARKKGCRVYIPSGAISGVDAVKASACGKIKSVILTTRKNPKAFKGVAFVEKKRINLAKLRQDMVLFNGTARQAVIHFPQNINVAAVLSLAGLGVDKTRVRIIASPNLQRNVHEIEVVSDAGRIVTRTENVLHPDNPKTSYLAVLSAQAALKQILEPVRIGS
ncbi:MAG TPA: aspartate dehydrogenase [Candidatus Omnitrophota bacterium]|nr:aspartate dehydrogenase [Candidatus Omnitrophota bacterium]